MRDLFYATPARLKFMKSERAETAAIAETVKRLGLAQPRIAFSLTNGERAGLKLPACAGGLIDDALSRLGRILGEDFVRDALPVRAARGPLHVEGFAGLPTLHRPNALQQYLIVNGRPVRDRLLASAVRAAYGDLVPNGRQPMLVLFLTVPPEEVDVNVHPAKTELRFRDPQAVRGLVVTALHEALAARGSPRHGVAVANGAATHGAAGAGGLARAGLDPCVRGLRGQWPSAARAAGRAERRYEGHERRPKTAGWPIP